MTKIIIGTVNPQVYQVVSKSVSPVAIAKQLPANANQMIQAGIIKVQK